MESNPLTYEQNNEVNYMTLFMNEKDMNEMLDSICPEGETYQGKAWGTLMSGTAEMLALGALSNVYCYVGVTEKTLIIAVLETFDISHIYGKILLPFTAFPADHQSEKRENQNKIVAGQQQHHRQNQRSKAGDARDM